MHRIRVGPRVLSLHVRPKYSGLHYTIHSEPDLDSAARQCFVRTVPKSVPGHPTPRMGQPSNMLVKSKSGLRRTGVWDSSANPRALRPGNSRWGHAEQRIPIRSVQRSPLPGHDMDELGGYQCRSTSGAASNTETVQGRRGIHPIAIRCPACIRGWGTCVPRKRESDALHDKNRPPHPSVRAGHQSHA